MISRPGLQQLGKMKRLIGCIVWRQNVSSSHEKGIAYHDWTGDDINGVEA